jgi:hypothetical protein
MKLFIWKTISGTVIRAQKLCVLSLAKRTIQNYSISGNAVEKIPSPGKATKRKDFP